MNPPTDIGKRELSAVLRSRFTEIFVTELTDVADLQTVVTQLSGSDLIVRMDPGETVLVQSRTVGTRGLGCHTQMKKNT